MHWTFEITRNLVTIWAISSWFMIICIIGREGKVEAGPPIRQEFVAVFTFRSHSIKILTEIMSVILIVSARPRVQHAQLHSLILIAVSNHSVQVKNDRASRGSQPSLNNTMVNRFWITGTAPEFNLKYTADIFHDRHLVPPGEHKCNFSFPDVLKRYG